MIMNFIRRIRFGITAVSAIAIAALCHERTGIRRETNYDRPKQQVVELSEHRDG